jgi:hypothetical protein
MRARQESRDDQQGDPGQIGVAGQADEDDDIRRERDRLAPATDEERKRDRGERPHAEPQSGSRQRGKREGQVRGVAADAHLRRARRWRYRKYPITTSGSAMTM